MCNGCGGTPATATTSGLVFDPRRDYAPPAPIPWGDIGVTTIPVPGVGGLTVPFVAPQPLPEVRTVARPFPWGMILAGVALFLVLGRSR